ncbi:matrixin family metalloprotease [Schleiferilactobacillus harbinensis]|uniref:matrixin family metalloprotease n=1 Tax=Schleiferilactobacillus harbinensis TaxID=304207 RepID=UPI00242EC686|nr:matrixin family metalloprotease [Schleiferilactobacillus harbinensis]MCI1850355.1 matrixin family metalloprotease [Schleiferilactobacillus harbinensis]
MKKTAIKALFAVLAGALILFGLLPVQKASAAYDYYTKSTKNYNGVTYQKFWAQDATLSSLANDSMYLWNSSNNTGIVTNMNLQNTTNRLSSIMDFVRTNVDFGQYVAARTFNDGKADAAAFESNWGCSEIRCPPYFSQIPYHYQRAVIAHEIGHGLGLMHNNDWGKDGSIMYDRPGSGSIIGPQARDMKGVRYLYGGY